MKYIYLLVFLLVSGCSSQSLKDQLTDTAIEAITGKDYSRDYAHCPRIKKGCANGNYEEWPQENGKMACACNK
ncbi:MAG: hypothetical protein OCD00_11095 [Colwellia sp.]